MGEQKKNRDDEREKKAECATPGRAAAGGSRGGGWGWSGTGRGAGGGQGCVAAVAMGRRCNTKQCEGDMGPVAGRCRRG